MAIAAVLMLLFKADYRRKAAEQKHDAAASVASSTVNNLPEGCVNEKEIRVDLLDSDSKDASMRRLLNLAEQR